MGVSVRVRLRPSAKSAGWRDGPPGGAWRGPGCTVHGWFWGGISLLARLRCLGAHWPRCPPCCARCASRRGAEEAGGHSGCKPGGQRARPPPAHQLRHQGWAAEQKERYRAAARLTLFFWPAGAARPKSCCGRLPPHVALLRSKAALLGHPQPLAPRNATLPLLQWASSGTWWRWRSAASRCGRR